MARVALWLGISAVIALAVGGACSYRGPRHELLTAAVRMAAEPPGPDGERYRRLPDNPFLTARERPLSTFSVDVDTASYANVRRFLNDGQLPPPAAVRIEELINYFRYRQPEPEGPHPLAVTGEVAGCPWQPAHRLVRIALKARTVPQGQVPPRNLTFLIDVSGSMVEPRKLPLLKHAFNLLVNGLRERDRVSIVVYAGAEGLVLPPTSGADQARIRMAIERLEGGGSTNGGAGIELAYLVNAQSAAAGTVNRVILATDGDFNVGVTSEAALTRLIEEKRRSGIYLSVLGFGMGNLKDATLERLADKGNGNYAYIDSLAEARKVLVEEVGGTLLTVARDVKVQVAMNAAAVASYRLVGYENRALAQEQFDDDRVDAGEMGSGQTVTALYEVMPTAARAGELLTVNVRYKLGSADRDTDSRRFSVPVRNGDGAVASASEDFRFAAAVAAFGLVLGQSPHRGEASLPLARALGEGSAGADEHRREFLTLVDRARQLEKSVLSRRP